MIVHREPSDEITPGQHVWLAELQDRLTNGWEGRPPPNPRGRGRLVLRASQGLELARSSVTIDEVCEVVWGLAEMIEAGQADTNDWRGVYVFSGHFEGVRDRVKTWREKQARRKRETEPESAPSDPCLTEDVIARQIAQSEVLRGR